MTQDTPVFDAQPPNTPLEKMAASIFGNHTSPQAQTYMEAFNDLVKGGRAKASDDDTEPEDPNAPKDPRQPPPSERERDRYE